MTLQSSCFDYANFSKSQWDSAVISGCSFKESFWSEVRFKKLRLEKAVFSGADFFKTSLKDVDLSDCKIDGIMVSETFKELRGAKINFVQCSEIARLLGIKII